MSELSWFWIAVALTVPPVVGTAWSHSRSGCRNNRFSAIWPHVIIFGAAIALIGREHIELERITQACLDQGRTCWPNLERLRTLRDLRVHCALRGDGAFSLSLKVETRIRRRGYAPEWR